MSKKLIYLASFVLVLSLVFTSVAGAGHLIGWWKFDGDTLDYSGLDNHGTAFGNPTFVDGTIGSGALDFDGDDYVTMDGVVDDFTGDDVTMVAWIKTTTTGEGDWFSMNPPSGNQYLLCILNGDIRFYEGGWQPAAGVTVNDGLWHHIVATREDKYVKIYVDGVYQSSGSYTSTVTFSTGDRWSIAQEWDGSTPSDFYTGTVDDVRLYDRSITAEQVDGLFNGIDPVFVKAENPEPADGAILPEIWVNLGWSPGDTAASHDVYLGDNFDDVNDGTGDTFRGNQTATELFIGFIGYPYPDGLVPGTTYYWRIDEIEADGTTTHKGPVWSFWIPPRIAYEPDPADGAKFIDPNADLSWTAGFGAEFHYVYFGDNFDDVNGATGGLLQGNMTYALDTLEVDKTYYWRVDESADTITMLKGDVWSFKTRPVISIVDPNLVGWWKLDDEGTGIAVDYSGYDHYGTFNGDPQFAPGNDGDALDFDGDDYVVLGSGGVLDFGDATDFSILLWIKWAGTSSDPAFISNKNWDSGGNTGYVIADGGSTWQWNWNVAGGSRVDYDPDGPTLTDNEWHHLCVTHDRDGFAIFYVDGVYQDRRDISGSTGSINSGMPHVLAQDGTTTYGATYTGLIDDVRIYNKVLTDVEIVDAMRGDPRLAWGPMPSNRSTPYIREATPLNWSPGENASQHDVYFGIDRDTVADANASDTTGIYRGRQFGTTYTPPDVEWGGGPYYWRIDEYNTDATISTGRIWNFTVDDFIVIEDFEDYNDFEPDRIFDTWMDGWGVDTNGAEVGYADPNFNQGEHHVETTIVHGGSQSMPYSYENNFKYSEATYSPTQRDWTEEGVEVLSLWFYGDAANAAERMYVALNGGTAVYHVNPDAALIDEWTEWTIDLQAFTGVGLTNVNRLAIGFGDKNNLQAGGTGLVFFDDIRLYRPAEPQP